MNRIIRTISLAALLLSCALMVYAQNIETPDIEYANDLCELRDKNRVFVHAPLNTREQIVKELRKHSDLFIVERPEEADFFLIFTYTPLEGGSADGLPIATNGTTAGAELTAVKFVNYHEDKVRPRILFYWSDQKSLHNVPLPFSGISSNGFTMPRSGRSALGEGIARLFIWTISKKWSNKFYFDPFTNQLTVIKGGKLESKGAKAFLKALKEAQSSSYAYRCITLSTTTMPTDAIFGRLSALDVVPVSPAESAKVVSPPDELLQVQPPTQSRSRYVYGQPSPTKRTKKGRGNH